ncbi:16994_t:CDS:2, partial [Dentiscutata erythropus]
VLVAGVIYLGAFVTVIHFGACVLKFCFRGFRDLFHGFFINRAAYFGASPIGVILSALLLFSLLGGILSVVLLFLFCVSMAFV